MPQGPGKLFGEGVDKWGGRVGKALIGADFASRQQQACDLNSCVRLVKACFRFLLPLPPPFHPTACCWCCCCCCRRSRLRRHRRVLEISSCMCTCASVQEVAPLRVVPLYRVQLHLFWRSPPPRLRRFPLSSVPVHLLSGVPMQGLL